MSKATKRTRYSVEFKTQAVQMAKESGQVEQTAKNLGITVSTLYSWIKITKTHQSTVQAQDVAELTAELKQLKQQLASMTQERDILKKAAAYFAKNQL